MIFKLKITITNVYYRNQLKLDVTKKMLRLQKKRNTSNLQEGSDRVENSRPDYYKRCIFLNLRIIFFYNFPVFPISISTLLVQCPHCLKFFINHRSLKDHRITDYWKQKEALLQNMKLKNKQKEIRNIVSSSFVCNGQQYSPYSGLHLSWSYPQNKVYSSSKLHLFCANSF